MSERRHRVLVIDGDPVLRRVAERTLAQVDRYVVRTVASLADAQLVAETEPLPHVVLFDLDLPDGRGVASVQRVRQLFPDAILIVWTGRVLSDDERAVLSSFGSEPYLKALAPVDLSSVLHALLEGAFYPLPSVEPSWPTRLWQQAVDRLGVTVIVAAAAMLLGWMGQGLLDHLKRTLMAWLSR